MIRHQRFLRQLARFEFPLKILFSLIQEVVNDGYSKAIPFLLIVGSDVRSGDVLIGLDGTWEEPVEVVRTCGETGPGNTELE